MKSKNNIYVSLILLLIILSLMSLIFGTKVINIFSSQLDSIDYDIIYHLRIPRTFSALFCGATLACSGAIIQVILKNNLADSSILGFQSGSTLFAMIILLIIPNFNMYLPLFSFIGGILSLTIVLLLSSKKRGSVNLLLIGIAINSIFGSLIGFISIFYSDNIKNSISYLNGSLANISISDAKSIVIYSTIALSLAFVFSKRLSIFQLDDLQIKTLAISVTKNRIIFAIISVLLSCISVTYIGIISFVGLISPHICKMIFDVNCKQLLILSSLIGSILVLFADLGQRIIFQYYEIPVGGVMSFFGGLFFIHILLRSKYHD